MSGHNDDANDGRYGYWTELALRRMDAAFCSAMRRALTLEQEQRERDEDNKRAKSRRVYVSIFD
jgi:hypothetical protein